MIDISKLKYMAFLALFLAGFSDVSMAAKKKHSIYTGPPLVWKEPMGWYLNAAEQCLKFNRKNFEDQVARYSWEDFKKLRAGYRGSISCNRINNYNMERLKKWVRQASSDLENLKVKAVAKSETDLNDNKNTGKDERQASPSITIRDRYGRWRYQIMASRLDKRRLNVSLAVTCSPFKEEKFSFNLEKDSKQKFFVNKGRRLNPRMGEYKAILTDSYLQLISGGGCGSANFRMASLHEQLSAKLAETTNFKEIEKKKAEEEERKRAEAEAERKRAEEEERKRAEAEAERKRAEEEERKRAEAKLNKEVEQSIMSFVEAFKMKKSIEENAIDEAEKAYRNAQDLVKKIETFIKENNLQP